MKASSEGSRKRVVILMTPSQRKQVETKARVEGISMSELLRRAVAAYDPDEMQQLEELATAFRSIARSTEPMREIVARTNLS